jgi:hypothetical protein
LTKPRASSSSSRSIDDAPADARASSCRRGLRAQRDRAWLRHEYFGAGFRVKRSRRNETQRDERYEHNALRDYERWLRPAGGEGVQERHLQKSLHDEYEYVEV